ncbi:MAG: hypothetical protein II500_03820, partial [Campylobacter sp.]|nr:hypothetical protein [Campylobacter sp.]
MIYSASLRFARNIFCYAKKRYTCFVITILCDSKVVAIYELNLRFDFYVILSQTKRSEEYL